MGFCSAYTCTPWKENLAYVKHASKLIINWNVGYIIYYIIIILTSASASKDLMIRYSLNKSLWEVQWAWLAHVLEWSLFCTRFLKMRCVYVQVVKYSTCWCKGIFNGRARENKKLLFLAFLRWFGSWESCLILRFNYIFNLFYFFNIFKLLWCINIKNKTLK
jgi:hypothetical protein